MNRRPGGGGRVLFPFAGRRDVQQDRVFARRSRRPVVHAARQIRVDLRRIHRELVRGEMSGFVFGRTVVFVMRLVDVPFFRRGVANDQQARNGDDGQRPAQAETRTYDKFSLT